MIYEGSCHCGAVTFEVEECNCSTCSKTGFLHLIVPLSKEAS